MKPPAQGKETEKEARGSPEASDPSSGGFPADHHLPTFLKSFQSHLLEPSPQLEVI